MKKLKIEYVSIGDLKPYERNAKLHPKEQVEQIKNSIKEFGFNDPVAVWKDSEIIEGHGRLLAAQELGLTEIPIIRLDSLTDQQLIWVKNSATIGRQDFQHQYESVLSGLSLDESAQDPQEGFSPCLYGWKDGAAHKWYKKRKERDVMFFDKPRASKEHPTMKPILLFDYEMQCNTKSGDSVLDLFGGSGTLIMAAEQNKRTAYVMEYDPKFVDVIIDRWEKFTGQKAVKLN